MTNKNINPDGDISDILGLSHGVKPKKKKYMAWAFGGIIVIILIFFLMGSKGEGAVEFKTEAVREGGLTVTVTATGTLEPTNQVDVGSELSGIIETVEVDYNDLVVTDQVLARLDTTKLKAEVMKSEAALESARGRVMEVSATLWEKEKSLKRIKHVRRLTNNKSPSRGDLDGAQAALKRTKAELICAKAAVTEAQATLDYKKTDLAKAVIRSPINGIVLTRSAEPGQTVAASLQAPVLFTLAEDLTRMELHVDVDEADVSRVKEGQEAAFTVDAYADRTFPAGISQIRYNAQTLDGVVTYETILTVNNNDLLLRPGMTATADIIVEEIEKAVLIPNAALRFTPPESILGKGKGNKSGGGFLSKIFPRGPGGKRGPRRNKKKENGNGGGQVVWGLRDNAPVPYRVKTGVTDGLVTEMVSGNLKPGIALAVDTVSNSK